ncbi:TPA: hypothetical protein H2W01_004473 [Salmonella enterica]|nr:hypothetical protein [Salmonella enterica]
MTLLMASTFVCLMNLTLVTDNRRGVYETAGKVAVLCMSTPRFLSLLSYIIGADSAKWFVVWLVILPIILPMILHRVETSGLFSSGWVCALVVGVFFGLCVPLVDYVLSLVVQRWR